MPIPIIVSRLGWNMEEGIFVEWLKNEGEVVRSGDVVFRLEGEKATEDVESLDEGMLHITAGGPQPGDRVRVGTVIGYLLQASETASGGSIPASGDREVANIEHNQPATSRPPLAKQGVTGEPIPVSPRARRLAAQLGVDCATLHGSGRNGRVRERDVLATSPERTVLLTPTRRAIAANMLASRQTTAPVTLTSIVDATRLVNLRRGFKEAANGGLVPSYTDFLVKFATVVLLKHPQLTSQWTDAGIIPAWRIDIGIAVDTDAGLLVPIIRDVPALSLRQLAAQSRALINRARGGTLSSAEMQGGCFTITNLGAFGIDAFTPIINPPQCAILGVGRIERRPVMEGDRVVGRELVTLSLTFDHRIVDGGPAARFLQTLAKCIENPDPWVSTS